jgi:hypothetical protein
MPIRFFSQNQFHLLRVSLVHNPCFVEVEYNVPSLVLPRKITLLALLLALEGY